MRRWLREQWLELRARSAGRKAMGTDKNTFTTTRGITGMIGASFSGAYDLLEKDGGAYLRSMEKEPMLPPSLFISERDRVRHGTAIPLSERCIEDHGNRVESRDWDISELDAK